MKNHKKNNSSTLIAIISCLLIVGIVVVSCLFASGKNKVSYTLEINGDNSVVVYKGNAYNDPGARAYDSENNDLSSEVSIINNVNTNKTGKYEITYTLGDMSVKRIVRVIDKPGDSNSQQSGDTSENNQKTGETVITLKGEETVYIDLYGNYKEEGFTAVDSKDGNIKKKVKVTHNVDNSTPGVYEVVYTVKNSSGITTSVKRQIIVMNIKMTLSIVNSGYTNGNVGIKADIVDEYFDYLVLPNGQTVVSKNYTYNVSENGTYKFKLMNKHGAVREAEIEVKNIDREVPSGSCVVDHNKNGSFITINASDVSGISKYGYNNKMYTSNKIILNKYIDTAEVVAYDNAGNSNKINCRVLAMKDELFVDTSHYTDMTGFNVYDVKITSVDLTNLGCNFTYTSGSGRYVPSILVHQKIGKEFHGILNNVCKYVNKTPWLNEIQTAGAYVDRPNIGTDYHAIGLAIDLNNEWTYTFNGKKYRPYPDQGEWTWHVYNEFICEVCDGKEDCQYNVNYVIWKRYFEGNGWCWYGNKAGIGFDPMHYELRVNNDCGPIRTETVSCN